MTDNEADRPYIVVVVVTWERLAGCLSEEYITKNSSLLLKKQKQTNCSRW